jgi:hypothetical protein
MAPNLGFREDSGTPLHEQQEQIECLGREMNRVTSAVKATADTVKFDVTEANPHEK